MPATFSARVSTEFAFDYEREQPLGHGLVIDGMFNVVMLRRFAYIGSHFDIEDDGLPGTPLPVVNTDDGIDAQIIEINDVHVRDLE